MKHCVREIGNARVFLRVQKGACMRANILGRKLGILEGIAMAANNVRERGCKIRLMPLLTLLPHHTTVGSDIKSL